MTDTSTKNIGFAVKKESTNPLKKMHCISEKAFVVIDDNLVKKLGIDKDDTWFEQEQKEDGILLKIHRFDRKGIGSTN